MKKSLYFEWSMLAFFLLAASAYATDMRLLTCDGSQKIKVEVPSKISGQEFEIRCDSRHPDSISFIYTPPGSENGLVISIVKTKQMKTSFMVNIMAEQTIEDTVVNAKKTNIMELPRPNAVGKDSNNRLVSVFAADNSIVEIHDGRQDSSEEALVAFASGFAELVGPIISSWKE